jgi:hypothetical protein
VSNVTKKIETNHMTSVIHVFMLKGIHKKSGFQCNWKALAVGMPRGKQTPD